MNDKLLYNKKFRALLKENSKQMLSFLLAENTEFSVVCKMDGVTFEPILPEDIMEKMQNMTIFALGGYTLESAFIESDTLIFEAGFGPENFGSNVTVEIDRILQIIIGDTPIFINLTANTEKIIEKSSFDAFKKNPKNEKFFKK